MSAAYYIQYWATPYGYAVTAYDAESQPVEEYSAGNSRACSQTYIAPDMPGAVPVKTLRTWAEAEAYEMAERHGLDQSRVSYDEDGEKEALEMQEEGVF